MHKLLFLAVIFIAVSCNWGSTAEENNTSPTKVEVLKEEVMAAHDRVMPKMNPMAQQQKKLRAASKGRKDSMEYIEVALQLRKAQEKMMNWMRNFKAPGEQNWPEEKQAQYLQAEKMHMLEIEAYTNRAMAKADSLLAP